MKVKGKVIHEKRLAVGKETRELAVAADLSERRIQQLEQGETVNVNLNVAKAIAKCLGVKLESIAARGGTA
jgi:transcriptional regulator with XRE-family HTH domain